MKMTFKVALELAWIFVNAVALGTTIVFRIAMWQLWDPINHLSNEQIQTLTNTASRDRLNQLFVEVNEALSQAAGMIRLMETVWVVTVVLNIALVIIYYLHTKPRIANS